MDISSSKAALVQSSVSKDGVENCSYQQDELPAQSDVASKIEFENSKKLEVRTSSLSANEIKSEKRSVWKSLLWLCLALTLGFAAYMTLINSITSLLPQENLGISALAVVGASQVVCAALLVPIASKLWSPRRLLQASFAANIIFVCMFYYPTWVTMMIGAVIFGPSQAILISTSYIYANSVGYWYDRVEKISNLDAFLVRMSGLVNCALGGGFLWGNLAMYFILDTKSATSSKVDENLCGASYCNEPLENDVLEPPSPTRYYTLVGALTIFAVVGFCLMFLIEDFTARLGQVRCSRSEAWSTLLKTWLLLKDPRGFLLVPITVLVGMEESFVLSDVTKAFVSCSLNISMVGMVMLAFGVTEIPVSIGNWPLVKKFGRCCVIGVAVFILLVIMITMLLWKPNSDHLSTYFIVICLWAASDSLLMSIVFATYAALFEDNLEGAFSVGIFWWSAGFLFWFGWSQFVCIYVKLYFLIFWIVLSYLLYVVLERVVLRHRPTERASEIIT